MLLNVSSEVLYNKEFQDEIDLFIRHLFSVIPTNVVEATKNLHLAFNFMAISTQYCEHEFCNYMLRFFLKIFILC